MKFCCSDMKMAICKGSLLFIGDLVTLPNGEQVFFCPFCGDCTNFKDKKEKK